MRKKIIFFYFSQFVICVFIIFISAEILIRIFTPKYLYEFRDATSDWILDDKLGWVNKPNLDITFVTDEGQISHFQTNQDGVSPANARRMKDGNKKRIMIFGDSVVVGRAVAKEKTVSFWLESILCKKGLAVEVINAGVQGYSTDQSLLLAQRLIPVYRPDIVIYGFCENDLGGNVLRQAYGIAKPVFVRQKDASLKEIPPEHPPNFQIHSFGSSPIRRLLQYCALYRFLRPYILTLRAKLGRWEEKNLIGLPGEYFWEKEALMKADWQIFISLVKRMKIYAGSYGSHFFFYSHPELAQVWDPYISTLRKNLKTKEYNRYVLEDKLAELSRQEGIDFCPLIDFFLRNKQCGPFHLLPRDNHCNGNGYLVTAEALTEHIMSAGYLNPPK